MIHVNDSTFSILTYHDIRTALIERKEIAILDVREEAPFAEAHPLFAANFPLSRLETDVYNRLPNRLVNIVVYDNGEGLAKIAANSLIQFGYQNVNFLEGGLDGWRNAGGEIFSDVNSPSKAFGELVESKRHTPSLTAQEVNQLLKDEADIVVLDVRRYDEYHTMSIPKGISVPGAELVLRVKELAPDPKTRVIVNCAGRTRSIIGTQSLVNAGIENPVYALRNGTIGWTLAGQKLDHGQKRFIDTVSPKNREVARESAAKVAFKAGVKHISLNELNELGKDKTRTNYFFDVRSPNEYLKGHLPDFLSAPGGQLVQETDHFAPVRGARIFLYDDDGVRANMTASWLAQMAWEVYVLYTIEVYELTQRGNAPTNHPLVPQLIEGQLISVELLRKWLSEDKKTIVIDLATAASYIKNRIPGAWYVLRSQLGEAVKYLPDAGLYVLTSPDGVQAHFVANELQQLTKAKVYVLNGGTNNWVAAGYQTENGEANSHFASPKIDRYQRPYEGTNNSAGAMQAYLDWEYGLVAQLEHDGTHGFFVI